jgi:L-2-hydroxyglutarate oxidase LhgO
MLALRGDAEEAGAVCAFHAPLLGAKAAAGRIEIEVGGDAPIALECRLLVNAAGLGAPAVARSISGMPIELIPPAYLAKGNYFSCQARAPFSRLIYPVPEPGGLGVHLTLDMAGQARFGPDVEWVETIDYAVDPARAERFYPAIRRYWPTLPDGALMPSYSGIRPKIVPPAVAVQDFLIQGPRDHGVDGLINMFGIESPGLTSSLARADQVGDLREGQCFARLGLTLVQGLARGMLQPLDLVLDHQFPALQLDNLQIVCGKMHESVVQFIFENLVFAFQFNKMRLHCHSKSPR